MSSHYTLNKYILLIAWFIEPWILNYKYRIILNMFGISVISHVDFITNENFGDIDEIAFTELRNPLSFLKIVYLINYILKRWLVDNWTYYQKEVGHTVGKDSKLIISFLPCSVSIIIQNFIKLDRYTNRIYYQPRYMISNNSASTGIRWLPVRP